MTSVSLKHKCLSYSLITTNKRSNLWTSSHVIKSEMHKQNQKDFYRLVVRLGYKSNWFFFLWFLYFLFYFNTTYLLCVLMLYLSLYIPINFPEFGVIYLELSALLESKQGIWRYLFKFRVQFWKCNSSHKGCKGYKYTSR